MIINKVFGVGITGKTKASDNGVKLKSYVHWKNMLSRCYGGDDSNRAYKGCSVSDEWLVYENFKSWHNQNYVDGYHLDKDILCAGNKTYSSDTCAYVPKEINKLILRSDSSRGELPQGVQYHKRSGMFYSHISKNSKTFHIGSYKCKDSAFLAYVKEKESYVKNVANKYFNNGLISKPVLNGLIEWKVICQ